MEKNEDISGLQHIMLMVSRVHGDFSNIITRGGNEQKIVALVAEMFKNLNKKNFLSKEGTNPEFEKKLRMITFALIVNTKLDFKHNLEEDEKLKSVINKEITLSKVVLMECIWSLNLDVFLYETIAKTPPWFSLQVLDAVYPSLRYLKPYSAISRVRYLLEAHYYQICRLQFVDMDDATRKITLTTCLEKFLHLLHFFINPKSTDISQFGQTELTKYTGYCLKYVLHATINCLKNFNKIPQRKLTKKDIIYNLSIGERHGKPITPDAGYEATIKDTLKKCNGCLFDTCKANLNPITLDIFLCWSEMKYENTGIDLQIVIANEAYELLEIMKSKEELKHDVEDLLSKLAQKPKDLKERIREADLETILENVLIKNPDQKQWFNKMVEHGSLFKNVEMYEALKRYVILVDFDNIKLILKKGYEMLNSEDCDKEAIKEVVLMSLKNVKVVQDQITAVQKHFLETGLSNTFEKENFEASLTEVFNKTIVVDNYKLQQMLGLTLQNPVKVYNKIMEACIKNMKHVNLMSEVLKQYKQIGDISMRQLSTEEASETKKLCCDNLALTALNDTFYEIKLNDNYIQIFVILIKNIFEFDIIEGEKLLSKFIIPSIQLALTESDFMKLKGLLQGLSDICLNHKFIKYQAPLLVIMAQVLDRVRWDVATFSVNAVQVISLTTEITEKIIADFIVGKTDHDKDVLWLRKKLQSLKGINSYYYQRIWNLEEYTKTLGEFLADGDPGVQTEEYLVALICENLPRCTKQEALMLVDRKTHIDVLCNALTLIATVVQSNNESAPISSLQHCVNISAAIIKDIIIERNSTIDENINFFKSIINFLIELSEPIKEQSCLSFVNIITLLLNNICQNKAMSETLTIMLQEAIESLNCESAEKALLQVLTKSTGTEK